MNVRFIVLACAAVLLVAAPRAAEPPCEFDGVERIVAVGDAHGAYDRLVEILRIAGIINERLRWTGGQTNLVQVGDVLDRGPDSRKIVDLYRRLEREASSAKGRVHYLIGNHEAMRLLGDFRYVDQGEYAAFATPDSAALRRDFVEGATDPQVKAFFASQPLGAIEMIRAFGPKQPYGAYLRTLNAVVRINGVVFVHGGISPAIAPRPCGEINATIRRELSAAELEKTKASPTTAVATSEDGPLWYRGLAQEPDSFAPQVDEILKAQQARAIVVAHTVQITGKMLVRFGGKVIAIDTGMQSAYVPTGRPSALEIRGGVFTAIYPDGREVLVGPKAASEAR